VLIQLLAEVPSGLICNLLNIICFVNSFQKCVLQLLGFQVPEAQTGGGGGGWDKTCTKTSLGHVGMCAQNCRGLDFQQPSSYQQTNRQININLFTHFYIELDRLIFKPLLHVRLVKCLSTNLCRLNHVSSRPKKGHPFFEKGQFRVPNSKRLTFSHHFLNKTHEHVKWGLKSILPDQKWGHPFLKKKQKRVTFSKHYVNKIHNIALFSMLWKIGTNDTLIFGWVVGVDSLLHFMFRDIFNIILNRCVMFVIWG